MYCINWQYADYLNSKFKQSYFVHLIRNPAQVVYSLVFPKVDAYPYRDIFNTETKVEEKFKKAIERWYSFLSGSQEVCQKYKAIEIIYEKIDNQIEQLGTFLDLLLSKRKLLFVIRNNVNVDKNKFHQLEKLWQSGEYANEFKKRQEIELIIHAKSIS